MSYWESAETDELLEEVLPAALKLAEQRGIILQPVEWCQRYLSGVFGPWKTMLETMEPHSWKNKELLTLWAADLLTLCRRRVSDGGASTLEAWDWDPERAKRKERLIAFIRQRLKNPDEAVSLFTVLREFENASSIDRA